MSVTEETPDTSKQRTMLNIAVLEKDVDLREMEDAKQSLYKAAMDTADSYGYSIVTHYYRDADKGTIKQVVASNPALHGRSIRGLELVSIVEPKVYTESRTAVVVEVQEGPGFSYAMVQTDEGKVLTAANNTGVLLSEGKRVLITADTEKHQHIIAALPE